VLKDTDLHHRPWRPYRPGAIRHDLGALKQKLLRVGSMVEESAVLTRAVLAVPDLEAAPMVRRGDDRIDRLYRELEHDCRQLLTGRRLRGPEVSEVLCYLHGVRDLERIGDYCKEVAELGEQLLPYQPLALREPLLTMLDRCRSLLSLALDGVSDGDAGACARLLALDDLVDHDYERLLKVLCDRELTIGLPAEATPLLVLTVRCLERMADHAVNVTRRMGRPGDG
jgi:phosphate transport system protein